MADSRRSASPTALRAALAQRDPEPVIAILEELATPTRRRRLTEMISQRVSGVTIVMDAPHHPHNVAAVMRSCDAFGVQCLHVVERQHPFMASSAIAKGTERWVDVVRQPTAQAALDALREADYQLIGAHPEGALLPAQLADLPRVAIVLGNEHEGICDELTAACDAQVRVPMRGFVESLNVSVSAAILLCHATSGRPGDLSAVERRRLYARGLALSVPRALDVLAARGIELLEAG